LPIHAKEGKMRIERLREPNVADAYCCLGDRRDMYEREINECAGYMRKKLREGWLAYAVYDDTGKPVGMAILIPSSDHLSPVAGEKIYYFHCLDINKNWRKRGIGSGLTDKIAEEIEADGGKGLVVDSYGEFWMPSGFFSKRGFEPSRVFADHSLMLRKISRDAGVLFTGMPYKGDLPKSGIQMDIQYSLTCPFMLSNYRKAAEIARKLEPGAVVRERMIATKEDVERWGASGIYVNGESISSGPVDETQLKKAFAQAKSDATQP
jgi:N-acetylglutamate synthase-like GNAT family acetyltransferase